VKQVLVKVLTFISILKILLQQLVTREYLRNMQRKQGVVRLVHAAQLTKENKPYTFDPVLLPSAGPNNSDLSLLLTEEILTKIGKIRPYLSLLTKKNSRLGKNFQGKRGFSKVLSRDYNRLPIFGPFCARQH